MSVPVFATLFGSPSIGSALWQSSLVPPKWGIFDSNNKQIIFPDSVLEFGYRKEFKVSNFTVQLGAFANYNKVTTPFEIQLRLSKAGKASDRRIFINSIGALAKSIAKCNIRVPEGTYYGCNAFRFELFRRMGRNAEWIDEAYVYFLEIQEVAAQYTNTGVNLPNAQDPAAQPVANQGSVQPQLPSTAQATASANAMASTTFNWF